MIKRILVLLDPSRATCEANKCAIRLAAATGAGLTGMAIADVRARTEATVPMGIGTSEIAREARQDALEQERKDAQESLAMFAKQCAEAGLTSTSLVSTEADTLEAIVSESLGHDLVVLGEGSIPGELGSTELSIKFMKKGTRPILAVGNKKGTSTPGKVLVGLDDHPQSWKALHMFLLTIPSSLVHHVTVFGLSSGEDEQRVSRARLERAGRFVESRGIRTEILLQEGDPVRLIPEVARERCVDTIVLGPYSKPAIERFFFPSVTKALLTSAEFSVFLYH